MERRTPEATTWSYVGVGPLNGLLAILSLAYPVAVTCVLLSRTAREYYGSIRA